MADQQARCGLCSFFEIIVSYPDDDASPEDGMPEAVCRRFPPITGEWPVVLGDDWCGEWAPTNASTTSDGDRGA